MTLFLLDYEKVVMLLFAVAGWMVGIPIPQLEATPDLLVNTDLASSLSRAESVWIPSYYWHHMVEVQMQSPLRIINATTIEDIVNQTRTIRKAEEELKKQVTREDSNDIPDHIISTVNSLSPMIEQLSSRLVHLNKTLETSSKVFKSILRHLTDQGKMPSRLREKRKVDGPKYYNTSVPDLLDVPLQTAPPSSTTLASPTVSPTRRPQTFASHSPPLVGRRRPAFKIPVYDDIGHEVQSRQARTSVSPGTIHVNAGGVVHQHLGLGGASGMASLGRTDEITLSMIQRGGSNNGMSYLKLDPLPATKECILNHHLPWKNRTAREELLTDGMKVFLHQLQGLYPFTLAMVANDSSARELHQLTVRFQTLPIHERGIICLHFLHVGACDDPTIVLPWDSDQQHHRRIVRGARSSVCTVNYPDGILSYDWSITSWLYGNADNKGLNKLKNYVCNNERAIVAIGKKLENDLNRTLSTTSSIISTLSNQTTRTQEELRKTADTLNTWSAQVQSDFQKLNRDYHYTEIFAIASNLAMTINHYSFMVSNFLQDLEENSRTLMSIVSTALSGQAPIEYMTPESLIAMKDFALLSVEDQFRFIPGVPLSTMILKSQTTIMLVSNSIFFSIYIPMIQASENWSYWVLHSIPMPVANVWVQLAIPYHAIGYCEQTRTVALFTEDEWSNCVHSKLRTCPRLPMLSNPDERSCVLGLIRSEQKLVDVCPMKGISTAYAARTYALMVSSSAWLVTTSDTDQVASSVCRDDNGMEVTKKEEVSSSQLIRLPLNCVWTVDNITIYPQLPIDYHQRRSSYQADLFVDPTAKNFKLSVPTVPYWLPNSSFTQLRLNLTVSRTVNSDIPTGVMALKQLSDTLRKNDIDSVLDEIYSVEHNQGTPIPSIDNDVTKWTWEPDWSPVEHSEMWILIIVSVIIGGLAYLKASNKRSNNGAVRVVGGGVAAHSLLSDSMRLRSLALQIVPIFNLDKIPTSSTTTTTTTTTTTAAPDVSLGGNSSQFVSIDFTPITSLLIQLRDKMEAHTEGEMQNSISASDPLGSLIGLTQIYPWLIPSLLMTCFFVITMICHWVMRSHVLDRIRKAEANLGRVPRNMNIPHHIAETRVILICLLELTSVLPSWLSWKDTWSFDKIKLQAAIQLSTLPGTAQDWVVVRQPDPQGFMNGVVCNWWDCTLRANIQWGPFCIRRTSDIQVSACESLPSRIRVHAGEVRDQICHGVAHPFYSMTVVGLMGVILSDQNSNVSAYTAGRVPDGNRLAADRNIPLHELV